MVDHEGLRTVTQRPYASTRRRWGLPGWVERRQWKEEMGEADGEYMR